ncbi:hypothetical protein [Streptomyces sp. DH37]|uniref:hypothetical protein n=1 Tax=Streptomyces sp. DH37 TaxID=3040122 RepID=UPI0024434FBA|nr:hypothetical protein [Streptomyces sp. DH37]MDG9706355.1 hypothetical protein [Streptomyces sp. DH37]
MERSWDTAGRLASGRYPRLAAAIAEDAPPADYEAVFERAVNRILDAFEHGGSGGSGGTDAPRGARPGAP